MNSSGLLREAFGRIGPLVHDSTRGLGAFELAYRPDSEANSIAWLIWHLARVEDDHVAGAAGLEQVWTSDGWRARFDLPFDAGEIGYGHSSEQVGAVRPDGREVLCAYYDAVAARTEQVLSRLSDADLDRVVDDRYDPPVTLGVRLASVLADVLQHVGQAAYLHGLVERAGG